MGLSSVLDWWSGHIMVRDVTQHSAADAGARAYTMASPLARPPCLRISTWAGCGGWGLGFRVWESNIRRGDVKTLEEMDYVGYDGSEPVGDDDNDNDDDDDNNNKNNNNNNNNNKNENNNNNNNSNATYGSPLSFRFTPREPCKSGQIPQVPNPKHQTPNHNHKPQTTNHKPQTTKPQTLNLHVSCLAVALGCVGVHCSIGVAYCHTCDV